MFLKYTISKVMSIEGRERKQKIKSKFEIFLAISFLFFSLLVDENGNPMNLFWERFIIYWHLPNITSALAYVKFHLWKSLALDGYE